MSTRIAAADAFLRSDECLCPFARFCMMHYGEVSTRPQFDRKALLKLAKGFAPTQGAKPAHALVVVAQDDYYDYFETTKTWAIATFLELMVVCNLVSDVSATVSEVERLVSRQIRPLVLSEDDPRRPHLALNGAGLITICMAPVYPVGHPRYAPLSLVAVTWQSDIAGAQASPDLVTRIRENMKKQHGFVYDANDLMLPLPGAA